MCVCVCARPVDPAARLDGRYWKVEGGDEREKDGRAESLRLYGRVDRVAGEREKPMTRTRIFT